MNSQERMRQVLEREFQEAATAYDEANDAHNRAQHRATFASTRWQPHWQEKANVAKDNFDAAWRRLHAAQIATGRTVYEDDAE